MSTCWFVLDIKIHTMRLTPLCIQKYKYSKYFSMRSGLSLCPPTPLLPYGYNYKVASCARPG